MASQLFQDGVTAAKAGQRERARDLLRCVIEQEPDNATAWLWLSGVTESLDERADYLERAATLEPDNPRIARALETTRQQMIAGWMRESAAAIEAGASDQARELLTRVVTRDEANAAARIKRIRRGRRIFLAQTGNHSR